MSADASTATRRTIIPLIDVSAVTAGRSTRQMNRGHRLARWFTAEFGSTQCRAITQCEFSTAAGVSRYIEGGTIQRCRAIAQRVALTVDRLIKNASKSEVGLEQQL